MIVATEWLGILAARKDQPMRAATLIAWADTMRESINNPRPPSEQIDVDQAASTILAILNEEEYSKACSKGQRMTTEQLITFVLDDNHSEGKSK